MKIGIDMDGVLTDLESWQLDYGSKFYYEKFGKNVINHKGYETNDIFDSTSEIDDEFWEEYYFEYNKNVKVRPFADEITKKLMEEGNTIYIITARGSWLPKTHDVSAEDAHNIAIEWLNKNNISYDEVVFAPEDKYETIKNKNIDLMIEDKVTNINNVSKIIPVIVFNAGYNENCKGDNIYRAHTWYDVYYTIKNSINK